MLPEESLADRNLRLFDTRRPVALITGSAAPRVGRRIAEHFLAQEFQIVLHAHQASEPAQRLVAELQQRGHTALLVTGDVQDETQIAQWRDAVVERFGRLDVLVNSAAIWEPTPLEHATSADYQNFFQVNTLGSASCGQIFGLSMASQPSGGAIINIVDWAVARPYRDFAAYLLSKSSLVTLTQALAVELAERNPRVRVNAVLPGPIQLAEGVTEERRRKIVQACLLKREGTADDVAQAIVFLATSPFITGVCLPVDGGRTIWAPGGQEAIAHPDYTPNEDREN